MNKMCFKYTLVRYNYIVLEKPDLASVSRDCIFTVRSQRFITVVYLFSNGYIAWHLGLSIVRKMVIMICTRMGTSPDMSAVGLVTVRVWARLKHKESVSHCPAIILANHAQLWNSSSLLQWCTTYAQCKNIIESVVYMWLQQCENMTQINVFCFFLYFFELSTLAKSKYYWPRKMVIHMVHRKWLILPHCVCNCAWTFVPCSSTRTYHFCSGRMALWDWYVLLF